jgi:cytochrome c oxidase assembly protein subunit 11
VSSLAARNTILLRKLLLIAALMLGFCFAMVPFYRQICKAVGINDSRDVNFAAANSQIDAGRTITLELVASVNQSMPVTFESMQKTVLIHPGQISQIRYRVVNNTERVLVAQAVPSYSPQTAAGYVNKLQCFCFDNQTLQPHEVREMPVVFVISPELPRDVDRMTLAYTFFDITAEKAPAVPAGSKS